MSADNAAAPVVDAPVADAPAADAPAVDTPAPVFYKIAAATGDVFRVEKKCLMMSKTLNDCATNLGYEDDNIEERDPIPLTNVSEETFKQVVEYMENHKNDAPRAEGAEVVFSAWDTEFLKMDHQKLFDLICAANFLDIKGLLDITCKTVANMIKGKSPEEMREIWEIPTDEEDEAAEAEAARRARENAESVAASTSAASTSAASTSAAATN